VTDPQAVDRLAQTLAALRAETEALAVPSAVAGSVDRSLREQGRAWLRYGFFRQQGRRFLLWGGAIAVALGLGAWSLERRLSAVEAAQAASLDPLEGTP
jgi:hypothetical protein